jgi:hypothetical protein
MYVMGAIALKNAGPRKIAAEASDLKFLISSNFLA